MCLTRRPAELYLTQCYARLRVLDTALDAHMPSFPLCCARQLRSQHIDGRVCESARTFFLFGKKAAQQIIARLVVQEAIKVPLCATPVGRRGSPRDRRDVKWSFRERAPFPVLWDEDENFTNAPRTHKNPYSLEAVSRLASTRERSEADYF